MNKTNKQHGAVSLFVVIFAALLITVVTVSFIRIMIQNQQQSTANDLSQSAYDSAQAGVEDGKRAILLLQSKCDPTSSTFVDQNTCDTAQALYEPLSACNVAVKQLDDVDANTTTDGTDEVKVKTKAGSENLNQAYTCVKITTNTTYVEGSLMTDESKFIPLVGVSDFDRIKIEWFTRNNLLDIDTSNVNATIPTSSFGTHLFMKNDWPLNLASVIRAQLIEFGSTFKVGDFDSGVGSNNALFLYPSWRNVNSTSFSINSHPTNLLAGFPGTPSEVICNNISRGGYSCSATVQLPKPIITINNNADHKAYLNLKSFYKGSDYKVSLLNGASTPVLFKNVQPEIDSTGRANDIFRRVRTRVEFSDVDFPFPSAEINVTGRLCKNFVVINDENKFPEINPSPCSP